MNSGDPHSLRRFVEAQRDAFEAAISELHDGRKRSHWMWFIFPQLAGLGHSPMARHYAISSIEEARCYVHHAVLGPRLRDCVEALLPWAAERTAVAIFGRIDAIKLRSSLTLFGVTVPGDIFDQALRLFFGSPDERTLALLKEAG